MKKTLRILSLVLVLVMMVSTLAACGGNKNPVETKKPTGDNNNDTFAEKWNDVNFGGTEVIMQLNAWHPESVVSAGASNSIKYVKGPDDYTTDAVQNAVFDRNNRVTNKLGINIEYKEDTYSSTAAINTIENFVLADLDDSPDIAHVPSYSMLRAGIKGLLYNALTDEEENYFDFTEENNWYVDFMYENTLDESKIFMLAGDYFIDLLRCSYGAFVNMDMYEELYASDGGMETLYQIIRDGDWTYDEFMNRADPAYVDRGSIGVIDKEDSFGAYAGAWWYYRTLFSTSGLDIFEETDDGKIAYVEDISEIHTFVEKLMDMILNHDSFLNPHVYTNGIGEWEVTKVFTLGNTLFALDQFILNLEGTTIRSMDQRVGVIPYPKYTKDGEYGALISDNGNLGGILYNSDKFTESSALLQMLCEESNKGKGSVLYEYYDVTLKYKYSADPGQIEMLETIRDGLCSPKSFLLDNYFARTAGVSTYGDLISRCVQDRTNKFASTWASQVGAAQQVLDDTYKIYGVQE